MKKRVVTGAAAALTTALTMGSCGIYGIYGPDNTAVAVYGPPEWFEGTDESEASSPALEINTETSIAATEDTTVKPTTAEETIVTTEMTKTTTNTTVPENTAVTTETTKIKTNNTVPENTTVMSETTSGASQDTTIKTTEVTTVSTTSGILLSKLLPFRKITAASTTTVTSGGEESDDFDPSEEEPVDVYGPPEWFDYDPDSDDVTEPDDDFDPSEEEPVDVYGPPEWFE